MTDIRFRRGQTFSAAYELTVTIDDENVSDLTGFSGEARLKPQGMPGVDLDFAWVNPAQRLAAVTASGSTADWPLGEASIEVQLTSPSGGKIDVAPADFLILRGFGDD